VISASHVLLALNVPQWGEQIRRADGLADMIADGSVTVISDGDAFVTIRDSLPPPVCLPWLPDADA
jgi:hypothetical protein